MDKDLKKALSDRIYDKRKLAALELETQVREDLAAGRRDKIQSVVDELSQDFAYAVRHPNYRNGGLIGLAGVAIALGQTELANFLDSIVQPILACFGDADARVRYYACESLYNVAKVAKGEILQYFNEIFDILCKLIADPEESVRNGADLVDHLIKDIVAEKAASYTFLVTRGIPQPPPSTSEPLPNSPRKQAAPPQQPQAFSLRRFIPLLVERIYVINPTTRMFLVQWIMLLDSIPDLELVAYLPEFLEGLLLFLTDSHKEVRTFAKKCLNNFLKDIKSLSDLRNRHSERGYVVGQDTEVDNAKILEILLDKMDPSQDEIRLVVLEWLDAMLDVAPTDLSVGNLAHLVQVLLPTLSDELGELRGAASHLSDRVLAYLTSSKPAIDEKAVVHALTSQLDNGEKTTRLAALDWLRTLHAAGLFQTTLGKDPDTLALLLKSLKDESDDVVADTLALLAQVLSGASDDQFRAFFERLFALLEVDSSFLASRGRLVCAQLAILLEPERCFRTYAAILGAAKTEFAGLMVQNLNGILITAPELAPLRTRLRALDTEEGASLFTVLFQSWSSNSVGALALCLLAEAYEHAFSVLEILASLDVTVSTLVQIDRLVQLIEGPVFAPMRLHLLDPKRYLYLYRTLYGLLMVLPQSPAFTTLNRRLSSVTPATWLPAPSESYPEGRVDWSSLLDGFQRLHLPAAADNSTSTRRLTQG